MYSLLSLARTLLTEEERFTGSVPISNYPTSVDWWSIVYQLVGTAFAFVPVVLVLHLLRRSAESPASIGLDASRPRYDVLFGLALTIISLVLTLGAIRLGDALGLPIRDLILVNRDAHPVYTTMFVISSARAGLTEEIIGTGYLIHRLLQIEWSPRRAIIACGVVRGAYHLYQGEVVFLGHLITGIIAGAIFVRTRRLWPLILAHFAFDAVNYFGYYFLGSMR